MADTPKRASLLGLPRELRLQIYDQAFLKEVQYTIAELSDRREMFLENALDWPPVPCLRPPYLSLMFTCKTTTSELQAYMQEKTTWDCKENRTYVLDMRCWSAWLVYAKWARLPCSPHRVQRLVTNFTVAKDTGYCNFWGDGGPDAIVKQLYQMLNSILFCGPRMDRSKPLPQPMHVEEVVVIVKLEPLHPDQIENKPEKQIQGRKWLRDMYQRQAFEGMRDLMSQIAQVGMAYGLVDRFRVIREVRQEDEIEQNGREDGKESNELVFEVKDKGDWEYPAGWERYGFTWGLPQNESMASSA